MNRWTDTCCGCYSITSLWRGAVQPLFPDLLYRAHACMMTLLLLLPVRGLQLPGRPLTPPPPCLPACLVVLVPAALGLLAPPSSRCLLLPGGLRLAHLAVLPLLLSAPLLLEGLGLLGLALLGRRQPLLVLGRLLRLPLVADRRQRLQQQQQRHSSQALPRLAKPQLPCSSRLMRPDTGGQACFASHGLGWVV